MFLLVGRSYGALLKRFSVMRQLFISKDLLHTRCHHDAKARVNACLTIQAEDCVDYGISDQSLVGVGYRGYGALRASFPVYRQP